MATAATSAEIEVLRHQAMLTRVVVRMNVEGVTHEESLIQPATGGNCMNWVVGHLTCIYNNSLPLFGQEPVVPPDSLKRYDRGSPPITDAAEAMDFGEILDVWSRAADRVDAGLAAFPADALDRPAPFSPGDDPNETVRSLLSTILFHQAYHAGQTGLLRRAAGKEGAIK
ncbi:MAG TPA: DinB family protein [Longimicrobium sp.]|nr:DinB family protein [Longimicrobium sp.]